MANIAQLLTEHIDIWTTADTEKKSGRGRASGNTGIVYGVKKLRELILELAVRGKLVPQDPNDESASELLKRIQAEKAKLIAEGKLKKEKPLAPISDDEKPFELPNGWQWVRNCELFQLRKGRIPKSLNEDGLGLPYLDIDALDRNILRRYSEELTCPQCTDKDILVVCDGSRSGLILDGKNGIIGSTLSIVDTPIFIQNYIKLIFKQGFEIFNTSMKGAAIPHLDTQKLLQNPTALPPLAEQQRIVAKIDELMELCDQLEQKHNNAQEAHATLVSQLLAMLIQSQNAVEFNANWQRIYAHFDVLFTTEASIDALKRTLLQLAVMGKLVPQEPHDEPASELLKRVQAKKAKLIAEGKLKKEKPLAPIGEDEKPFELPHGWEWVRLDVLALSSEAGWSPQCLGGPRENDNWGVLKVSAVTWGDFKAEENKGLPDNLEPRPEYEVKAGDFLISRANTAELVAKAVVVPTNTPRKLMMSDKIIRFVFSEVTSSDFVNLINNSSFSRDYYAKVAGGTSSSMKNVSREQIRSLVIPLPPKYEQHRILAKVDTLIKICDQLKTRMQQSNQQQQAIADVFVTQAAV